MIGLFLVAFILAAAQCSVVNQREYCNDDPELLFPHPTDCTQYYQCANYEKEWHFCPENLHFNRVLMVCDYPENAKCVIEPPSTHPTTSPTTVSTQTPTQTTSTPQGTVTPTTQLPPSGEYCNDDPEDLFPHPTDCTQYYQCSNNQKEWKTCPFNLHFNRVLMVCDYPESANCLVDPPTSMPPTTPPTTVSTQTTSTPQGTVTPTTQLPPSGEYCNDDPEDLFPHPTDCTQYYQCSNNQKEWKTCPFNLHFNRVLMVCDYPESANCVVGPPTSMSPTYPPTGTPTATPPGPPTETCTDDPEILKPHLSDCTQYYQCTDGYKQWHTCPPGLHFNAKLMVCDYPESAGCQ